MEFWQKRTVRMRDGKLRGVILQEDTSLLEWKRDANGWYKTRESSFKDSDRYTGTYFKCPEKGCKEKICFFYRASPSVFSHVTFPDSWIRLPDAAGCDHVADVLDLKY